MGVKVLIFLVALMVSISSCAIGDKTKPVVTDAVVDIGGEAKEGAADEAKGEAGIGEIPKEIEEEKEQEENKSVGEEEEKLPLGTHLITIKNLRLDPQELTIKKGDTVIWKHEDTWEQDEETRHYLAAHTNEFRTPILYYGDTFEHTFDKTGTFTYIDVLYKERNYMRGKIVVE